MAVVVSGGDVVVLSTAPTREHPDEYVAQSAHVIPAVTDAVSCD